MLSLGAAQAQSSPKIKVTIPFDFAIGSEVFPSGQYFLEQPMQNFVVLRDAESHAVASAFTHGVDAPQASSAKLRFVVRDGRHVLTEFSHETEPGAQKLYWSRYDAGRARTAVAQSDSSAGGGRQ